LSDCRLPNTIAGTDMSNGNFNLLRIIHEYGNIAVIVSQLLNNMCSMFNFWGRVEKLTLVAVIFNSVGRVSYFNPTYAAQLSRSIWKSLHACCR